MTGALPCLLALCPSKCKGRQIQVQKIEPGNAHPVFGGKCTQNLWAKSKNSNNPGLILTRTIKKSFRVLSSLRLPGLFPWDPSTLLDAENSKSFALLTKNNVLTIHTRVLKNIASQKGFIIWKSCLKINV